ncbi:MAG: hypothetical protein SOV31_07370 [Candidatus Cryptobacteroides sp.]|nr:hypothetical protein [Candidatus Cryptobacteroides sp.]
MVSPATAVAATRSASDSNFVAAKKNRFACRPTPQRRAASILDFRLRLANRCKLFPV